MTDQQVKKIEALTEKIEAGEEDGRERNGAAAGGSGRPENGKVGHGRETQVNGLVELAFKVLLSGLEKEMKMADCERLKTLKGVLDVLIPIQGVKFFAATSMLQILLWTTIDDWIYKK
ncbi:transcription factor-related [Abeliophyllum distichum]|uniref:Transcription factor-related n=1 Tax=Abeliophyllum distichum TaxID=126358 RepID=A0ABD1UGT9_9LAMI